MKAKPYRKYPPPIPGCGSSLLLLAAALAFLARPGRN